MTSSFGVIPIELGDEVASEATSQDGPVFDRRPYLTFRPHVEGQTHVVQREEQVRSTTRLVGSILLASAATVALVHGIYFSLDDHPVAIPEMNQVTIVLAIYAYMASVTAFRGRWFIAAMAGPILLLLVVIWDYSMQYECFCTHMPYTALPLLVLIGFSLRFIFHTSNEFLD